jgi:hypothetical protein
VRNDGPRIQDRRTGGGNSAQDDLLDALNAQVEIAERREDRSELVRSVLPVHIANRQVRQEQAGVPMSLDEPARAVACDLDDNCLVEAVHPAIRDLERSNSVERSLAAMSDRHVHEMGRRGRDPVEMGKCALEFGRGGLHVLGRPEQPDIERGGLVRRQPVIEALERLFPLEEGSPSLVEV